MWGSAKNIWFWVLKEECIIQKHMNNFYLCRDVWLLEEISPNVFRSDCSIHIFRLGSPFRKVGICRGCYRQLNLHRRWMACIECCIFEAILCICPWHHDSPLTENIKNISKYHKSASEFSRKVWIFIIHSFCYKNTLYKNIEAQFWKKLRTC